MDQDRSARAVAHDVERRIATGECLLDHVERRFDSSIAAKYRRRRSNRQGSPVDRDEPIIDRKASALRRTVGRNRQHRDMLVEIGRDLRIVA